jgi:hypothetical protein
MRQSADSEPRGGRRRRVVGIVVVVLVAGSRRGALRGHDLRQPGRRGARGDVLRAAHAGDASGRGGAVVVVRGGGRAARGGGARAAAAAAALPDVDGAPRP